MRKNREVKKPKNRLHLLSFTSASKSATVNASRSPKGLFNNINVYKLLRARRHSKLMQMVALEDSPSFILVCLPWTFARTIWAHTRSQSPECAMRDYQGIIIVKHRSRWYIDYRCHRRWQLVTEEYYRPRCQSTFKGSLLILHGMRKVFTTKDEAIMFEDIKYVKHRLGELNKPLNSYSFTLGSWF